MEIVPYGGWQRCLRLSDGVIELVATLEVGPRIIRFGFVGGANHFAETPDEMGKVGGAHYRSYGGHRLWIAPEVAGRTDLPDNEAVQSEEHDGGVLLTAPVEVPTGMQRSIAIQIGDGVVRLRHILRNCGEATVECAPWCLSVMAPGGTGFFPQEEFIPHSEKLLPSRPLVLWGYTDMSDERWTWGKRLVRLRQLPIKAFQKVGALVTDGWAAYANQGELFVKSFAFDRTKKYADFGCNFETFTRVDMLELESLGPLESVAPGGVLEHRECWTLARPFSMSDDDSDVLGAVLPIVEGIRV